MLTKGRWKQMKTARGYIESSDRDAEMFAEEIGVGMSPNKRRRLENSKKDTSMVLNDCHVYLGEGSGLAEPSRIFSAVQKSRKLFPTLEEFCEDDSTQE